VFECPDVRTAEMLWYESHQLPHSPAITGGLLFALPMTSAQQIAQIISTTPVFQYSCWKRIKMLLCCHLSHTFQGIL